MMARQVDRKNANLNTALCLKARDRDKDVLGEFHQGPQASARMKVR